VSEVAGIVVETHEHEPGVLLGENRRFSKTISDPMALPGRMSMKVSASTKRMCEKCRIIRRHGRVWVICPNPRHKQRQG